jgi:hypothetical protein
MVEPVNNTNFRFSESVKAFYRDKRIRSAVELLIDDYVVFAPEADDWDQVEAFYDASMSAHQVQIDHAKDLFRLWMAVWSRFPRNWMPVAADPKDEELSLDPEIRWSQDYFERHFRIQHGRTVSMWVAIGDEGCEMDQVEIAFDIRKGTKSLVKPRRTEVLAALGGWRFEDDAMRLTHAGSYASDGLSLSHFQRAADDMFAFVNGTEW